MKRVSVPLYIKINVASFDITHWSVFRKCFVSRGLETWIITHYLFLSVQSEDPNARQHRGKEAGCKKKNRFFNELASGCKQQRVLPRKSRLSPKYSPKTKCSQKAGTQQRKLKLKEKLGGRGGSNWRVNKDKTRHMREELKNSRDGETKKAKQQGDKEDQLSKQRRKSLQLGHENHSDTDS